MGQIRAIPLGSRSLRFDVNALCSLEELRGEPVHIIFEERNLQATGLRGARAIVWAGLQHEEGGATLEEAGDLIQEVGFAKTQAAIEKALKAAMPLLTGAPAADPTKRPTPGA